MSDGPVGLEMVKWIVDNYRDDIAVVVTVSENKIFELAKQNNITCLIYNSSEDLVKTLKELNTDFDLGIMAWWPKIIKEPLISYPKNGFLNTHPSLLPYNRGKNYNFWALVEECPFGVTIHEVESGVDSGAIIAQDKIEYDWEDNGETMYKKAFSGMIELLKKSYPDIRKLDYKKTKQDFSKGSFHHSKELDEVCRLDLDKKYSARELLNLLRARTFTGYPACFFTDGDNKYEVRVNIKKVK